MDKYLYDAKTNAFYPLSLKADYEKSNTWPESGVEVGNEIFMEFVRFNPGKIRVPGTGGIPVWVDKPKPTKDELIASAEREKQRLIDAANLFMNNRQWPGKAVMGRLKGDELAQYNLWLDYLDELEAVDTSTAPDITWPERPV